MKKTPFLILLFAAAFIGWAGVTTSTLTTGYTGAPGEGQCQGCHTGGDPIGTGNMVLSGLPTYLISDTWYPVTVSLNIDNPDAVAGFQFTALNAAQSNFGSYGSPGSNVTIATLGSRTYAQHMSPVQVNPGNLTATFTFNWKSPPVSQNQLVSFYLGGELGNPDFEAGPVDLGFTQSLNRTVVAPVEIVSVNKQNVSCNGDNDGSISLTVQGGLAPISFQWSNGATGNTVNGLSAGTYSVTVSDELGQTATYSTTITQPAVLASAIFLEQPIDCAGNENGILSAAVNGGTPPFSYLWSTGATGPSINNLPPGSYGLTITDQNDCESQSTFLLTQPQPLQLQLFNQVDISCFGNADGLLQVNPSGGTPPWTFLWSTGQSGPTLSGVGAGMYTISVTDNAGCQTIQSFNLSEPDPLETGVNTTDPLCTGDANGQAQIQVAGGTAPYNYLWPDGGNEAQRNDLSAGTYAVEIMDQNGCESSLNFSLADPDPLEVELISVTPSDAQENTGAIDITPLGGTPPYTYNWYHPINYFQASTQDIDGLMAGGMYILELTDSNGCFFEYGPVVVGTVNATKDVFELLELQVPNPARNSLQLIFSRPLSGTARVMVWSSDGRNLYKEELPGGTRYKDISLTYRGLIWLQLEYENGRSVRAVVIE